MEKPGTGKCDFASAAVELQVSSESSQLWRTSEEGGPGGMCRSVTPACSGAWGQRSWRLTQEPAVGALPAPMLPALCFQPRANKGRLNSASAMTAGVSCELLSYKLSVHMEFPSVNTEVCLLSLATTELVNITGRAELRVGVTGCSCEFWHSLRPSSENGDSHFLLLTLRHGAFGTKCVEIGPHERKGTQLWTSLVCGGGCLFVFKQKVIPGS